MRFFRRHHGGLRPGAALLVIDMLTSFSQEGDALYQSRFRDVVDSIEEFRKRFPLIPAIFCNMDFESIAEFVESPMAKKTEPLWIRGSAGSELVSALKLRKIDTIMPKKVNSPFYKTELEQGLRSLDVTQVFIAGVHSHVCVLLTAVDAFYRGFDVCVLNDATTTIDLGNHIYAMKFVDRHLGETASVTEVEVRS
jgi:nicotinamidase-related amidase